MKSVLTYLGRRECGEKKTCRNTAEKLVEGRAAEPTVNQTCQLLGHARSTFLMDFSSDRRKMASTHGDHSVRITDLSSGKCTHVLTGHPRTPWCLAFHPSSNEILASGCLGGEVRIWDLHGGGSEIYRSPGDHVIASMTFHPSDHVLVFATSNEIFFWDWSKAEPFTSCKTREDYERVRWVRFDPLGHQLLTGIANGSTIQRDDSAHVSHISDAASDVRYDARQHILRRQYRSLLTRYQAYQNERMNAVEDGETTDRQPFRSGLTGQNNDEHEIVAIEGPRSPVHSEALVLARQYAAHVTDDSLPSVLDSRNYTSLVDGEMRGAAVSDIPGPSRLSSLGRFPFAREVNSERRRSIRRREIGSPPPRGRTDADFVPLRYQSFWREGVSASSLAYRNVLSASRSRLDSVTSHGIASSTGGRLSMTTEIPTLTSSTQSHMSIRPAPNTLWNQLTGPTTAGTSSSCTYTNSSNSLSVVESHHSSATPSGSQSGSGSGILCTSVSSSLIRASIVSSSASSNAGSVSGGASTVSGASNDEAGTSCLHSPSSGSCLDESGGQGKCKSILWTRLSAAHNSMPLPPVGRNSSVSRAQPLVGASSRGGEQSAGPVVIFGRDESARDNLSGLSTTSGPIRTLSVSVETQNSDNSNNRDIVVVTSAQVDCSGFSNNTHSISSPSSSVTSTTSSSDSVSQGHDTPPIPSLVHNLLQSEAVSSTSAIPRRRSDNRIPPAPQLPRSAPDLSLLGFRRIPSEALLSTAVLPVVDSDGRNNGVTLGQGSRREGHDITGSAFRRPDAVLHCDYVVSNLAASSAPVENAESQGTGECSSDDNPSSDSERSDSLLSDRHTAQLRLSRVADEHQDIRNMTSRLAREINDLDQRMSALRDRFSARLQALQTEREEAAMSLATPSFSRFGGGSGALPAIQIPEITITQDQADNNNTSRNNPEPSGSQLVPINRGHRQVSIPARVPAESPIHPGADPTWHTLQRRHLHPHYGVSILDETINRPNDALQAAINRAIAGAFMGTGEAAVASNIINLTHRIQCWDFSQCLIPDISHTNEKIVVPHCKIHNDASVDVSQDGSCLATFVPSHRGFPDDTILAVYSLLQGSLGQCLFTKSFGPNAISVSLSPLRTHLVVGLASRRLSLVYATSQMVAQVFKLVVPEGGESSMKIVSDIFHPCEMDLQSHISVNCVRWLPGIGEGLVYGTNKGDLHLCRPGPKKPAKEGSEDLAVVPEESTSHDTSNIRRNLMRMLGLPVTRTLSSATQTLHRARRTAATQTEQLQIESQRGMSLE